MKMDQSERGLFEKGFDDDLPQAQLERIIDLFPDSEAVTDLLIKLREFDSFTDMKRGELYPEVIGGVSRLRRTIASVYELAMVQSQPNFSCNGCIDTFLSHIQRLELTDMRRSGFMVATPTYFRYYHKVEALRLKLMPIPVLKDHQYPLDKLMVALKTQQPSCLILVTPNNPTGIPIPDEQLFQILDNVPDDLNVAIDRTCANIDPEVSTKAVIKKYPHKRLVIFHSFSKYYGMSHLRIGFSVFSNFDLASEVNRYLPFGLNLEALLKATNILLTQGELKPSADILNNIRDNKRLMNDFLRRHSDYSCTDFKSNYAILGLPKDIDSRVFHNRLQEKSISIMPGHDLPEPDSSSIRIHVGGKPLFLERMIDTIESWA